MVEGKQVGIFQQLSQITQLAPATQCVRIWKITF
jgi:hypothetical protein